MAKALTEYLSTPPAIDAGSMAAALRQTKEEVTTGGSMIGNYMQFSGKTGLYSIGRDKEQPDPEERFLVEPQSFITGWICWKGGKPIDRYEWSVYRHQDAVAEEDLPDHSPYRKTAGEGWATLLGFGMMECNDGKGQVLFSTSTISARNALGDMMDEMANRAEAGDPSMPIITLDAVEFEAQGSTNWKPVFNVEAWVTREAAAAYFAGDLTLDELTDGDAPKKKKAKPKAKAKSKAKAKRKAKR